MTYFVIKSKIDGELLKDIGNGRGKTFNRELGYHVMLYNSYKTATVAFRNLFGSDPDKFPPRFRIENASIVQVQLQEIE
jgi:hypothetical protein